MGEYDYTKPTQPMPVKAYDMKSLLSSMTNMEDEEAPFIGGVYGPAGSGKTFTTMELAQQITPPDKIIVYCFTNQGWTSLKNKPELMHRVKKMPYEDFDQIRSLCEALRNPQFRELTNIGSVVFDEFNTMFDMNIEAITNFRSITNEKGYKDPDTPEWPEYNTAKMHMINLMNDALATPGINFFFIAHPRFQKKTGFTEPDMFEKASQAFMRVLHSLYYLTNEEHDGRVVRRIQLMGTDQIVAKNRIGGLGMYANNVREISDAFKKWSVGKEVQSPASPKMEIESKVEEPISAKEPEPEVTAEEETVAQPEAVTPTVTLLDGDDMFAGMFS